MIADRGSSDPGKDRFRSVNQTNVPGERRLPPYSLIRERYEHCLLGFLPVCHNKNPARTRGRMPRTASACLTNGARESLNN